MAGESHSTEESAAQAHGTLSKASEVSLTSSLSLTPKAVVEYCKGLDSEFLTASWVRPRCLSSLPRAWHMGWLQEGFAQVQSLEYISLIVKGRSSLWPPRPCTLSPPPYLYPHLLPPLIHHSEPCWPPHYSLHTRHSPTSPHPSRWELS